MLINPLFLLVLGSFSLSCLFHYYYFLVFSLDTQSHNVWNGLTDKILSFFPFSLLHFLSLKIYLSEVFICYFFSWQIVLLQHQISVKEHNNKKKKKSKDGKDFWEMEHFFCMSWILKAT